MTGRTESFGSGSYDFWLIKTDETGNIQWNQTYGGAKSEIAHSLIETSNGGYTIVGYSTSIATGNYDCWLIRIDSKGEMLWNQTYGGVNNDYAYSLIETSDGGYAIGGKTESFGVGNGDFWLIKTDETGNIQWNQTYGGKESETARWISETSDGGYVLVGEKTTEDKPSHTFDTFDLWIIKTDESGNLEWNQTIGGAGDQVAQCVIEAVNEGYTIAGSNLDNKGNMNFLVIKTNEKGIIPEFNSEIALLLLLVSAFTVRIFKKKLIQKENPTRICS